MSEKSIIRLFWILQIGGWILYYSVITFVFRFIKPSGFEKFEDFFLYTITYVMGFLVTLALRYVYRYLYNRNESMQKIPVYLLFGSIAAIIVWFFTDNLISSFFWEKGQLILILKKLSVVGFFKKNYSFLLLLTAWGAMYFGIKYGIDWQIEKKRSNEAILLAQKAQMEMLRYQLNPHFLFNSLNSIRALVDEDGKVAREMITELSEFLRYSLLHKDTTFVTLSNELEAVKHYFSIEKKRFEEKLDISFDISEKTNNCQILSFLLHPLIENAVKYGMKTSKLPLHISLKSYKDDYGLKLEICNSGKWITPKESAKEKNGTGTGLKNVQKRLENAFGKNYIFETSDQSGKVCIKIGIKEEFLYG